MGRIAIVFLSLAAAVMPRAGGHVTYEVRPSDTDPAITRFDEPSIIVFDSSRSEPADLLVFMTGTGGKPSNVTAFLDVAAGQGYRAISIAYNDTPAVVQTCASRPDKDCSAKFRQQRIFGDRTLPALDDAPAESVVNRLVKLLMKLDQDHPGEAWAQYLDDSVPRWERIVVAGHSQGAGMAAYIAQRRRVARVVLSSSPWDYYGERQLAPWILAGPGETPADRWYAAYHAKENTAALLAKSYAGLGIPASHIRVFTLEPAHLSGANPYHVSMIGNANTPRDSNGAPAYADEWRFLIGHSP